MKEGDHFDGIASKYIQAVSALATIYQQASEQVTPLLRGRRVVDVGSGGMFAYDTSAPSSIVAMDVSNGMLDLINEDHIEKVVGDARDFGPIADGSFDAVVFGLVLHHVTGDSRPQTEATLRDVLRVARTKIRKDGLVIILESVVNPVAYFLETLLYPVTQWILGRSGKAMILLFSDRAVKEAVQSSFGREFFKMRHVTLASPRSFDPLAGSYPGFINIPSWISPIYFKLYVIELFATAQI